MAGLSVSGNAPRFAAGGLSSLVGLSLVLLVPLIPGCQGSEASPVANPRQVAPLGFTFDSPEALARAFLDALHRQDVETLTQFALSEDEIRDHVWPELPVSRIEKPLPFEYGWADLHQKSIESLKRTYAAWSGKSLQLVRVVFEGATTAYETFKVHRDARVMVLDRDTKEQLKLDLFGSILEKNGRFKLFSYVTD